jgi:alpha-N-arabinofuranosidase
LAYLGKQPQIGMVSVHFYTFAGNDWARKSPAIGFKEEDWAAAMDRTWKTDELISRHTAILDRHDPDGKVGIAVSEWGAWWATDQNRPSNLYQANTLRDAVIAGLTLNIFQNHAARVRMANLAQMVNVLQALILTDRERMLLTPTYHVFDLYQAHQGATLLPARVTAPDYTTKTVKIPSVSASASRVNGVISVSLVNLDPRRGANLRIDVQGGRYSEAHGRVISAQSMDARPVFGQPDPLVPRALEDVHVRDGVVSVVAPAKSILVLELRAAPLKSAGGQAR